VQSAELANRPSPEILPRLINIKHNWYVSIDCQAQV
jgi:hypothetical protein